MSVHVTSFDAFEDELRTDAANVDRRIVRATYQFETARMRSCLAASLVVTWRVHGELFIYAQHVGYHTLDGEPINEADVTKSDELKARVEALCAELQLDCRGSSFAGDGRRVGNEIVPQPVPPESIDDRTPIGFAPPDDPPPP